MTALLSLLSVFNPLKNCLEFSKENHDKAIPNSPFGYYGKISGKSAAHVMGLVYSQDPAAQMVGSLADIQLGMKVLDLCAAPGGQVYAIIEPT